MKNGCRKWCIYFFYHICCSFYLFVAGCRTTLKHVDVDYSEYLGQHYKKYAKKIKRTSTIVCNHISWLDPVVLIKEIRPAFAPSAEFRNVPLLGSLIDAIDSIYIPRGGSEEKKAAALAAIRDRQELIEEAGTYSPFLIFAEGGTSNGTSIMKFKKGAFFAERSVKPMFLRYKCHTVSPAFDVMEFLPLVILHLSWACYHCEVTLMPDFQPNEYLFETHRDKGSERWEVFSWAVRDAIIKQGGFEACDLPMRVKMQYEAYMQQK